MARLCSCTQSPGAMGRVAKPITWPNFLTGAPGAIGPTAILWPFGTRAAAGDAGRGGLARLQDVERDDDVVVGMEAEGAGVH